MCAQDRHDTRLLENSSLAHATADAERLFCLINAPPTGDTHDFDTAQRKQCEARLFRQLETFGLKIERPCDPVIVTTPSDFHRLFPATGGSIVRSGVSRLASLFQPAGLAQQDCRTVSGGRQHASGTRGADGGHVGTVGSSQSHRTLRFDQPVGHNGYAWWYMDALSDDGQYGMTVIAFIGSVFSPYYRWARRAGPVDPLNHCALNVALYGARQGRWAMTERGRTQVVQQSASLSIGPSNVSWNGSSLEVNIDEICAPLPKRLRGTIRVLPTALHEDSYALDSDALHHWTPYAPAARVEVRMQNPALSWSGHGYFDSNHGTVPLEETFREWTWSRVSLPDRTVVLYDTHPQDAAPRSLALQFPAAGTAQAIEPPGTARLPMTRWRLKRSARCESGAQLVKTLVDAPFYSRSQLTVDLLGQRAPALHESLSLERFRAGWVQCLLPFRMPRIAQ